MGVDIFAKIQNVVAYGLIISLAVMGVIGALGLGTGEMVSQPSNLAGSFTDTFGLLGLAFFLFLGCEFVIPISKNRSTKECLNHQTITLISRASKVMLKILQLGFSITQTKNFQMSKKRHLVCPP